METDLLAKYGCAVPRYTSYPTAPHFHTGVGPETYEDWLQALPADAPLSLYLHIPYCRELCWFCGCHTKITRRYEPVTRYLDVLLREIDLVAERLPHRRQISQVATIVGPTYEIEASQELGTSAANESTCTVFIVDRVTSAVLFSGRVFTPEE